MCSESLELANFYPWFERGVTHWLDISIIKALNRIQKAIDLDQLKAVDETVKYSSSAVDTLSIFYQIKIFWQQLDWPEVEGSYIFVAKIVNVSRKLILNVLCDFIYIFLAGSVSMLHILCSTNVTAGRKH